MRARSPQRAEFLAGIITTALEGGIGYWAAAEEYRWFDPDLSGGTAEPGPGGTCTAYAVLVPNQGEAGSEDWPVTDDGPRFTLTLDEVARALGLIRAGGVPGLSDTGMIRRMVMVCDRYNGQDVDGAAFWAGDIDADVADAIVQVAVFGDVVYG
jgi:hypothetical protein